VSDPASLSSVTDATAAQREDTPFGSVDAQPELPRAVICVGASAGGIEPLRRFVSSLREDLPAAVLVVVHFPPEGESALDRILGRASVLPTLRPADGERMVAGRVYVAPPDRHLVVADGVMRVTRGPRENALRPAVDPLFRTAAQAYGRHAIAVVLSGTGSDGSAGAAEIKERGGRVLVQDPAEALHPSMPSRTIDRVDPDAVLGAADLATFAASLTDDLPGVAEPAVVSPSDPTESGEASGFTCPECGGALWEHGRGGTTRFVCRVGHAYTPEALMARYDSNLEDVLWSSIRALEEQASLSERLASRFEASGNTRSAGRFRERQEESARSARALRSLMLDGQLEDDAAQN
jgi:two-component system chemotaxis response regulator CheB